MTNLAVFVFMAIILWNVWPRVMHRIRYKRGLKKQKKDARAYMAYLSEEFLTRYLTADEMCYYLYCSYGEMVRQQWYHNRTVAKNPEQPPKYFSGGQLLLEDQAEQGDFDVEHRDDGNTGEQWDLESNRSGYTRKDGSVCWLPSTTD